MKAVIIAGGKGSRLLPYTKDKQKCLLEVHNKSILDYQLAALDYCNIDDIAIVTGHCSGSIVNHLNKRDVKVTIIHNNDYRTTNNAYGIWLAKEYLRDSKDGFVLINSDLVFSGEMLKFLLDHDKKDGIMIEKKIDPKSDMVKIKMNGDNIIAMSKDIPSIEAVAEAIGPVKFSAEGGKKFMDFIGSFITKGELKHWFFYMLGDFARESQFTGIENPGFIWTEIDTPEDLEMAHNIIPKDFI